MFARIRSRITFLNDLVRRTLVERLYRRDPPPIKHGAKQIVVVEGLWDNPNHWLRLWIFLHAFLKDRNVDVVGVLRSSSNWDNWRKRKSLEALGVRRFIYLNDKKGPDRAAIDRANALLANVPDAKRMLDLPLPDDLPAYVYFDTVLKLELHPQPEIVGNPVWREALAELLQLGELYNNFFDQNEVVAVVSSHAWKSEWGSLCWTALRRSVPFYYMTAHYDSIRIRKMIETDDYRAPNEHLPYAQFCSLPQPVQQRLIDRGRTYLADRFAGNSDFIVLRYAVNPTQRGRDRATVVADLGLDQNKPLVVIYAHSWFDFPHTQAMTNFVEPLDWVKFTIETIKPLTGVNWAFKPHPCDRWYGTIRLADIVHDLPPHISIIPEDSDSLAIQTVADALVTIQGSIAIEAAAMGKVVLCADRSMYSDWGFTHTATSREDYAKKLCGILHLAPPTSEQSQRAMVFAATALAPPPEAARSLKLTCDTRIADGTLYPSIRAMFRDQTESLQREIRKMRDWLSTRHHSYNVWRTVDHSTDPT